MLDTFNLVKTNKTDLSFWAIHIEASKQRLSAKYAFIHARSPFTIETIRSEEITEPDNSAWPTSSQLLYL